MKEDEINKLVGGNLRTVRLLRGLNQKELGNPAKISYQQIQKYESGKDGLSVYKLLLLSGTLGIDPWFLFDGIFRKITKPILPAFEREHITLLDHYNKAPKHARQACLAILRKYGSDE